MSTKHTRGPWTISTSDDTEVLNWSKETYNNLRFPLAIRQHVLSSNTYNKEGHEEAIANARLIAAAPELLEALNEIGAALDNWNKMLNRSGSMRMLTEIEKTICFNSNELRDKARAVIAKAKGVQ